MNTLFYGFAVLLFAAVILLIEGAYLWWAGTHGGEAQRIARRLRLMATGLDNGGERISILKQRRFGKGARTDWVLRRLPFTRAIDRQLRQTGLKWSVAQFVCLSLLLLAVGLAVARIWNPPGPAAAAIVLSFVVVPYALLLRAGTLRLRKLEEQLPEAADFLARALRAGHSFSNALAMVGNELPEPIASEFRAVHEEINYGVPMNEALQNLAARVPLTDLRYLVIAVLVQRESGGNLAEILLSISRIIRSRLKLIAQVRVLSTEGRMSAWTLGLLPFGVGGIMSMLNPKSMNILWNDPAGITLLWYAAALMITGAVWMRNIIRIRV